MQFHSPHGSSTYKTAVDEAEKDKNNLTIEGRTNLGFLDPSVASLGFTEELVVKSSERFGKSVLSEVSLASTQGAGRRSSSGFSVHDSPKLRILITTRSRIIVVFKFTQSFIGRYEDRIEFVFENTVSHEKFVISRQLQVVVGDQADHNALRPVAPYVSRKRNTRTPEKTVVRGVAPPSLGGISYVAELPKSPIPKELLELLSGSNPLQQQITDIRGLYITGPLSTGTYAKHFKHLLWIEEHQTEADLERYDMSNVTLPQVNQYYYLAIPGLAEKRPSVLVGDRILVQRRAPVPQDAGSKAAFTSSNKIKWASPSTASSTRVGRLCKALDLDFGEDRVLFPTQAHVEDVNVTQQVSFINPLIASNPRQREAVQSIVHQQPGSPPFVVFGPPGTGKTVTIIEAIRQILRTHPSSRILACGPSNSAADLIAERLSTSLSSDELFRMYAPSRSNSQIPNTLNRDYTCFSANGEFRFPDMARLESFRVVVATCVASSMLSGVGIQRGHYTHIFIDEAGQATEPEAFISIGNLVDHQTNVVLSDDDIGIITPYHAQCLKIRTTLRSAMADGVKVGVEAEANRDTQERKVIMISTVRSSKDYVKHDLRHTLGFVANPRRFNVAVTRAKALLIVIGNPHVLSLDPLWRSFLNYIHLEGGWVGPEIPWDPQAPVDPQGRYDDGVRSAAEADMNEYTRRMEEFVATASGEQEDGGGNDEEGDGEEGEDDEEGDDDGEGDDEEGDDEEGDDDE
ncbi:hypothetical protein EST38_g13432 [Candolleomyces aberdarensis]|uniref:RNA helicase n=1 Tax=Candolleomyces aberdarensis TaxID=2316362 RepID=A0A4Q2D102_9AGAR|nr:hypothetical protein EST38_g13432 [Candolleomyces aberdarensis]